MEGEEFKSSRKSLFFVYEDLNFRIDMEFFFKSFRGCKLNKLLVGNINYRRNEFEFELRGEFLTYGRKVILRT